MVGVALAFASFFIIKSPDFSDIFLPSRSPVCDITELKQPRRPGGRRRQVNAEGLERERRFRREKET